MKLSQVYDYEVRLKRKCTFCDKVRLTTRAMWEVALPTGTTHIEVRVCNDCLCLVTHDR